MPVDSSSDEVLFEACTPLRRCVRVTRSYWEFICTMKHPVMSGRQADVKAALEEPHEIRQSRNDSSVYLFYRLERAGRWLCAVAKCAGTIGFLITAYPTGSIKEGVLIWHK